MHLHAAVNFSTGGCRHCTCRLQACMPALSMPGQRRQCFCSMVIQRSSQYLIALFDFCVEAQLMLINSIVSRRHVH